MGILYDCALYRWLALLASCSARKRSSDLLPALQCHSFVIRYSLECSSPWCLRKR
jgi:hypothetical protein